MIFQDRFGCDITIANKQAAEHWDKVTKGFLSHAAATGPELETTLQQDPQFALGHSCKGLFSLMLGRRELEPTIRKALSDAKSGHKMNAVSKREHHYIEALEAWINGRPSDAIGQMEMVLRDWPHDALAMKLSHGIRFMLGDLDGMLWSLQNLGEAYRGHDAEGYFNGCYAFALEEAGEYQTAERHGKLAIELANDDAWGLHAVSHVFDMTGRAKEGLDWMEGKEAGWEHCNNFGYHVWWHIALMHLELGEYDKVLELYDQKFRVDHTDDYRDISNATSALLRLEFEGVEVGNRWDELAELSAHRTDDNCVAFADLHYMMALCGAKQNEKASLLLSNMASCAEQRHHCEFARSIQDAGATAASGLEAYRNQDFVTAYHCLSRSRPTLQSIGGSHAQRDIFERLGIEAALRAGLGNEARKMLKARDNHRGHQDNYSISRWELFDQAGSLILNRLTPVAPASAA